MDKKVISKILLGSILTPLFMTSNTQAAPPKLGSAGLMAVMHRLQGHDRDGSLMENFRMVSRNAGQVADNSFFYDISLTDIFNHGYGYSPKLEMDEGRKGLERIRRINPKVRKLRLNNRQSYKLRRDDDVFRAFKASGIECVQMPHILADEDDIDMLEKGMKLESDTLMLAVAGTLSDLENVLRELRTRLGDRAAYKIQCLRLYDYHLHSKDEWEGTPKCREEVHKRDVRRIAKIKRLVLGYFPNIKEVRIW